MTLTIDLTPEQEAALRSEATARGLALPEFVKRRALEHVPLATKEPASGAELAAIFARWRAEAEDITPEESAREDAAWEQIERNLRADGVTMRRVDVSDFE
jgi:hypothetical protein